MSTFHRFKEWVTYHCKARSRHGVHSPFVYQFVEEALYNRKEETLKDAILHYFENYDILFGDWDLNSSCVENSLIILPGIYQNKMNTERWKALIAHPHVRLSIDIYEYGLLFFKNDFREKQHFVLKI